MMSRLRRPISLFVIGIFVYLCFKTLMVRNSVRITTDDARQDQLTTEAQQTSTAKVTTTEDPCSLKQLEVLPQTARDYGCTDCQAFTCKAFLLEENTSDIFSAARKWMTAHPVVLKNDSYFIEIAKDCDKFRNSRGYILSPTDPEEADYPLAFNLILHKDVAQIERLLRSIYRPQNEYCLHVDAKSSPTLLEALRSISKCFPNVRMASKMEYVNYAGFSRLQADINCMKDLTSKPNSSWKYLLNIAGQAFPLKTNLEMVRILKLYNGSNDIEGIFGRRILRGRFENEWLEPLPYQKGPIKKTGKKNPSPPFNIEIVRGSAYGIFSRQFVNYIINDEKAKALLEWSKKTWSPDEHYWATLHHVYTNPHLKTPGGYPGIPDGKPWLAVFAAWGGRDKCYGMWRHGICIFGVGDLKSLTKRKEFIANKFYMDFQPFALDCMEEYINYKVRCPPPRDTEYYKSLPFIRKNLYPWKKSR